MMRLLFLVVCLNGVTGLRFLPPGVASSIQGELGRARDLELDLHSPEEDKQLVSENLDSLLKIENQAESAAESDLVAQQQSLLNAEIAKIHAIVGSSKLSSQCKSSENQSTEAENSANNKYNNTES